MSRGVGLNSRPSIVKVQLPTLGHDFCGQCCRWREIRRFHKKEAANLCADRVPRFVNGLNDHSVVPESVLDRQRATHGIPYYHHLAKVSVEIPVIHDPVGTHRGDNECVVITSQRDLLQPSPPHAKADADTDNDQGGQSIFGQTHGRRLVRPRELVVRFRLCEGWNRHVVKGRDSR